LPDLAAPSLQKRQVPERPKGCSSRFISGKILKTHKLLGLLFDVFAQLFGQFVVKMPATKDSL
jgi:hypothetical protein